MDRLRRQIRFREQVEYEDAELVQRLSQLKMEVEKEQINKKTNVSGGITTDYNGKPIVMKHVAQKNCLTQEL